MRVTPLALSPEQSDGHPRSRRELFNELLDATVRGAVADKHNLEVPVLVAFKGTPCAIHNPPRVVSKGSSPKQREEHAIVSGALQVQEGSAQRCLVGALQHQHRKVFPEAGGMVGIGYGHGRAVC